VVIEVAGVTASEAPVRHAKTSLGVYRVPAISRDAAECPSSNALRQMAV
jgi:hypothetical protein